MRKRKTSKRGSFHRKTASFLSLGDFLIDEPEKEKPKKKLNETSNKENKSSIINYYTNDYNYNNNISFPSFDNENNNGSIIIKTYENDNENNMNENNIYKQLENNNIKNPPLKSFIPIVNTLKFVKEKEENATPSYLLALGIENNNNQIFKNGYIQKAQIIEEEKSEILITESEFSNKKNLNKNKIDFFNVKKQLNINFEKNLIKNNNNVIRNNKNKNFSKEEKTVNEENKEMIITLNRIMKKTNEKELKRRQVISKHKKDLLSIFFTLTKYNNNKNNSNSNNNYSNNNTNNNSNHNNSNTLNYNNNSHQHRKEYSKEDKQVFNIEKPKFRRTLSQGCSYVNSIRIKTKSKEKINSERIDLSKNKKNKIPNKMNLSKKNNYVPLLNLQNNNMTYIPHSKKNLSQRQNSKKPKNPFHNLCTK